MGDEREPAIWDRRDFMRGVAAFGALVLVEGAVACSNNDDVVPNGADTTGDTLTDTSLDQREVLPVDPTNRYMHFTNMPLSPETAQQAGVEAVTRLKVLTDQGIAPMVMFEPTDVDLRNVQKEAFVTYFQALKDQGMTDESMGTWALFPEPNIPSWSVGEDKGNTDPDTFVRNFITVATALREVFPEARVAVLLNHVSWENHDAGWVQGGIMSELDATGKEIDPAERTEANLRYTKSLPAGMVDEFHFQGLTFPDETDARIFANADAAMAGADSVGTKDIVLNTGTFAQTNPEHLQAATLEPGQRRDILLQILEQAKIMKAAGYNVTINLFAEEKYDDEANWSYKTSDELDALNEFLAAAEVAEVPVITFEG